MTAGSSTSKCPSAVPTPSTSGPTIHRSVFWAPWALLKFNLGYRWFDYLRQGRDEECAETDPIKPLRSLRLCVYSLPLQNYPCCLQMTQFG